MPVDTWKVFFYETCKFFQNNVFRVDLPERLALFISQFTETSSEPCHTSKIERFAKTVNDLPVFRLDTQHVCLHYFKSEILEN